MLSKAAHDCGASEDGGQLHLGWCKLDCMVLVMMKVIERFEFILIVRGNSWGKGEEVVVKGKEAVVVRGEGAVEKGVKAVKAVEENTESVEVGVVGEIKAEGAVVGKANAEGMNAEEEGHESMASKLISIGEKSFVSTMAPG